MRHRVLVVLTGLCLAASIDVLAQEGGPTATIAEITPRRFQLGDKLTVRVAHLDALCPTPTRSPEEQLRLFLDGRPLLGIPALQQAADKLEFNLDPSWARATDPAEENVWAGLVSGSLFRDRFRKVQASVGYETCPAGEQARTPGTELELIVISKGWQWAWLLSFLAIVGVTVWLARKTPLLREGGADGPYSLGRTQMAFWTVLALGAFLLILMSTGFVASLPGSVLALLGISAATGLGSTVVDSGKKTQMERRDALAAQAGDLAAVAITTPTPDVLQHQNQVALELAQLPRYREQRREGFWSDLLKDGDGYSIYRLQFVLWTVVLGGYFAYAVATRLIMPTFSEQLLLLVGISSGTYVTVKTQEKVV